ncbi:MAG: inverse autotransporter beta domain-containing protein [Alphaproteobacteria bacterium]|nr:inverse autotransporter beta domain-containing protein [Alphaproteobacteria bacterium]
MSSFLSKSLIGSLVCFTASSFAEEDCFSGSKHYRMAVRHIESGGVGYNQGYTTLEAFLAPDPSRFSIMPFVDFRGHVFDDGKFAANAGLGIRALADCRVYGANIYYDYRNTRHQHYNQIGLGFETLGVRWDFRANGYLPVGSKTSSAYDSNTTSVSAFGGFQGNHALIRQTFTVQEKVQYSMSGVNTEAAFHILKNENIDLYAAAGPYYYNYSSKQAIGGQARLGARIYEYFSVEAINSYDSRFHENIQGSIGINVPFGPRPKISKSKKFEKCSSSTLLAQRLVQDVQRQEIIVVDKLRKTKISEVVSPAVNPLTGSPFFFVFANNTSSSTGTYESPFPTFALVEEHSSPGDILYVFSGNGTTRGMDSGITLKEDQKLWGSGISHSLLTSIGTINIPAESSSYPIITNTNVDTEGNAITLAGNNSISGIAISSAYNDAIFGADPQSLEVSFCKIENTTTYAIQAIFSGDASIVLTNNQFLNNTNGVILTLNGTSTVISSDNTFEGQTSVSSIPLEISSIGNSFIARVENNVFDNNVIGAIKFDFTDVVDADINVYNNTVTNSGSGSAEALGSSVVIFSTGTTDHCSMQVMENTFSGNGANSLYFHTDGQITTLEVTATANTMSDNIGSAIVLATPVDNLTFVATDNTIAGLLNNAIALISSGVTSVGNVKINNNTIVDVGNYSSGISVNQNFSSLNLAILNNEINGCEGTGIISYANLGIDSLILNVSDNTISHCENLSSNAASGLDIEQFSNLIGSVANNTLSDNSSSSIGVFLGSTLPTPIACLSLTGNNSSADYFLANPSDGLFHLSPLDPADVNVGIINTSGEISPVQSCPPSSP